MRTPLSPWDDLYFASKGEVTYGAVMCVNWITEILHQIGIEIYILTTKAIYSDLAAETRAELLGNFTADDTSVNAVCARKKIYLP